MGDGLLSKLSITIMWIRLQNYYWLLNRLQKMEKVWPNLANPII
jgi:hypothetical protein